MGVASLILGVIALAFALTPLVYTQLVAIVVGVASLLLGIWGRRQAADQGTTATWATLGAVLGLVACLAGGALYVTFIRSGARIGEDVVQRIGGGFRRGEAEAQEFRRAIKRAIDRATDPTDP